MRYNTKQRELILECLSNSEGNHITAEDILDYLKKRDTPVGKSTIYRYLENLVEQGIVRKYTIKEGKSACYQFVGEGENTHCTEHYHLKCSVCDRLFHVSCKFMDGIKEHINEEHGFVRHSSKTVFYGVCADCREKL